MKNFIFPVCFLLTAHAALGTHNYAGEITYACDSLNPLKYYITITTYTKEASWQIEDCELVIGFGDNTFDTVPRSNGPAGNCAQPAKMGVPIGNNIKKNEYKTTHIYPGPGNYKLSVEVPNRSADIMNIPASVNVPFYIESELFISGFSGPCNNSVVLSFPPIDFACVMQTFITNPGAWDPDGDSLAYSLIPCKGQNGQPIPNYVYPNLVQNCEYGTFSIEPHTGMITWDFPICIGNYSVAVMIEEFRNGNKIGSVLRDMLIPVLNCSGVDEYTNEAGETTFYPNPTHGVLFIGDNIRLPGRMEVYDLTGALVLKCRIDEGNGHIDLHQLGHGLYFCEFHADDGTGIVRKIIIR